MHPDERRQEQRPETCRTQGAGIKNLEVSLAIVGLERKPAKAVIDIVRVNRIEGLGFIILGIFELACGRASLHGALNGVARLGKHVANLEIAERIPQTFGLAGFKILGGDLERCRIALVVVHAHADDVLEHAADTVVFEAKLAGQIESFNVIEFHRLLRHLFGKCILRRRKCKRKFVGKRNAGNH